VAGEYLGMNAYLASFAAAALLSLFLTRWCRDLARRRSWVDLPDRTRKFHDGPVPAIGGVALALSSAGGLALAAAMSPAVAARLGHEWVHVATLGILSVAMTAVGLADDLRPLSPRMKIALQATVAVAAWLSGVRIESLGTFWGSHVSLGAASLPVTVLWIVGITNAFNLLDGLDGLAAGAALFATTALMGVAIASHEFTAALILAAMAGATAAFLRYNFNPASIFLGDSGSLFLGFSLAVLAVQSSQKSAAAFAVAVPIVSLGVPVLDTTLVILRRLISAKPVFAADRRHIHHLLLYRGLSVRDAAIWMYAVSGSLALISLLVVGPYASAIGPILVVLGLAAIVAIRQLRIPELRALNGHVMRGLRRQRPMLAGAAIVQTMLDEMCRAESTHACLAALARGLGESGFTSATVSRPALAWHWSGRPAGTVVALAMPLGAEEPSGTLTLRARADGRHHAAIINWMDRDVAQAIGAHLARTAPGAAPAVATKPRPDSFAIPARSVS
jgi:UDP-GlcNAc:undecaprenyl-phosphate GlcNAc-1-phosphate transferase